MAYDPEEFFTIAAITRENIAEELNEYLDDEIGTDERVDPQWLTKDDCESYASEVGTIKWNIPYPDQVDQALTELRKNLWDSLKKRDN